ncbi:hypothetical protein [Adhaeretor mobilis]|uniref:Uncharacterized protein n=1 Tax=Adhaeretor mobilis TaxID=1930276 RepID=A0A517N2W7_9BACT|nr:hypothetical protein [Adhaeretor mobilis]QDT01474.1 hypothetical protein HG15A2_48160 [Adhaeretor mobilis]
MDWLSYGPKGVLVPFLHRSFLLVASVGRCARQYETWNSLLSIEPDVILTHGS